MKAPTPLCITLLLLLTTTLPAFAQFTFTGTVTDAQTGSSLPFANIFIANTTIGTTSQSDGSFSLPNVAEGPQEIVCSFLGYETVVKKINANEFSVQRPIDIRLQAQAIELGGVEVKALSEKKHKRYLKKFTAAFLGATTNANKCQILNPQVIDFQQTEDKVTAQAQDLIQIENRATGYLVKFYLEKFTWQGNQITYGGKPLFEELAPRNENEKKQWQQNRTKTFRGSPPHFYQALVKDELAKEGFAIFLTQQKSKTEFHNTRSTTAAAILREGRNAKTKVLQLDAFLKVVYLKENRQTNQRSLGNPLSSLGHPAEKDMIQQTQNEVGDHSSSPTSYLFAKKASVKITTEGQLLEPKMLVTYGDWAEEGIADLLPADFKDTPTPALAPRRKSFELSNLLLPIDDIRDGGPPKDGIPAIDQPQFGSAEEKGGLEGQEEILGVFYNGIAKAYPIKIMDRHEIVNDYFGEQAVAVTFCPLCASGLALLAEHKGERQTFGVSGLLYNSDVLLYDRQTESLWSQILGKAISGPASGQTWTGIPTEFTTWEEWQKRYPTSLVLQQPTNTNYQYDTKAYAKYFDSERLLFPVSSTNPVLKNKEKVIGIEIDGQYKAYPFSRLAKKQSPIQDDFNGTSLLIYYDKKSNTARISTASGIPQNATSLFWFAWYAFHPDTSIYR